MHWLAYVGMHSYIEDHAWWDGMGKKHLTSWMLPPTKTLPDHSKHSRTPGSLPQAASIYYYPMSITLSEISSISFALCHLSFFLEGKLQPYGRRDLAEFTHSVSDGADDKTLTFLPSFTHSFLSSGQLIIHLSIPSFLIILSARLATILLTQQILPCSHPLICLQNAKDNLPENTECITSTCSLLFRENFPNLLLRQPEFS